uniref:RAB11 family interacting protein 4 (class II) a n=1 Tax=Salarias fasciatus TaxID=181472 RepID=A0A672FJP4_SALFA
FDFNIFFILFLFVKRLKEVFDVCDQDADGFIRVEHLQDLALRFGQGEEVKKLTRVLDPSRHGRINFKDFCHGVFSIKGCEEILKMSVGPRSLGPSAVTDNGYIYQVQSLPLGPPIIMCTRPYPECSSYGERADCECDMDSMAGAAAGFCPVGFCCVPPQWSAVREEQFEDYGEGEDVEFTPSSPCPEEDPRSTGFSAPGSPLPPSAAQTPQRIQQLYNSELLDIYCSQCCKKVNLLNDLEARLRNLKANSPNRKISSTAFGRQLFQANHSVFGSSRASSTEDLFTDSIDSCDLDITEKPGAFPPRLRNLCGTGCMFLVSRIHELEEQVRDTETRADQSLEEELKRHREACSKMDRDRNTEIDLLCNRIQQLEDENGEMKINVCRLKSQTEKLDQEKQKMTDKLEDTSLRLNDEMDLYRKIMDKLWQNRHEFKKEKEAMQELIDDLRRELEYLQLFKLEMEHPGKGKGLAAKTREMEMEHEVKRLKQENFKLRDQNDDLNAQILSLSLYEAKNLFSCQTKAQCLAAEIDNASRDELVDALKEQEEINLRLRQYMDKIILAILDHNPSILEIKN